jgi:hypothetical protein
MIPKLYHTLIEPIASWKIGTEKVFDTRGGKHDGAEKEQPERGYTVVLFDKPRTTTCDWCQESVAQPATKVYSRTPGSQVWQAKCKECRKKRLITKE